VNGLESRKQTETIPFEVLLNLIPSLALTLCMTAWYDGYRKGGARCYSPWFSANSNKHFKHPVEGRP